jgi:flagellar export protein FliJ
MKAFQFRLDQVLKWRSSQVDVEKGRLAVALARAAELRRHVSTLESQLLTEALRYRAGTTGDELAVWGAYYKSTRKQIGDLEAKEREAEAALAACRTSLLEADRRLQLLKNLRQIRHDRWKADWNRELEAFAAESFLAKLQLEKGRARSSSG